jgi:hypothetical protein
MGTSMATKPLLLLALLTVYCEAGRLSVLYNEYSDGSGPITISVMDPSSGSVDGPDARTVAFPASTCTPGWSLSNGTHGQTSSVFAMNQTVFILAQETCTDPSTGITSYANTTVFGMFAGIFEDFAAREWWAHSELRMDPDDFRPYAELSNLTDNVLDMNINWDHTANVLLVAPAPPPASPDRSTPRRDGMPQRMQILEISEYDGEVRPKAVYNASPPCGYPKPAGGCWGRVNGLSTVDFHSPERLAALRASRHLDPRPLRARFREEHCENCSFYYLEEQIQYGTTPVEGAARNLIGRRVQTGSVTLNITDPTNLLSLQFYVPEYGVLDLPQSGAFFGVGVCCELAWCPPDCEGTSCPLLPRTPPRNLCVYLCLSLPPPQAP